MWGFQCFFLFKLLWFLSEFALLGVLGYVTDLQLQDLSHGHTTINEDINLECTVTCDKPNVILEWEAPVNIELKLDRVNISRKNEIHNSTFYITRSLYTISRSRIEDSSIYQCRVSDPKNPFDTKYTYIWVSVYNTSEHIIEFDQNRTRFHNATIQVEVYIRAHPKPTFIWVDKNNKTITPNSTKFKILTTRTNRFTNYKSVLKFNSISIKDFGNYTIIAKNKYGNKSFPVLVNMTGAPSIILKVERYGNNSEAIQCQSMGFPKPQITWEFEKYNSLSCFEEKAQMHLRNVIEMNESKVEENGLQIISSILLNKSNMGMIRAIGMNNLGNDSSVQYIYKPKNGFEIFVRNMLDDQNDIKVEKLFHEDIEIVCAVSLKDYRSEIKWFREGRNMSLDDIRVPIRGFKEYHIKNFDATYSIVSVVKFKIYDTVERNYSCNASTRDGKVVSKFVKVVTKESSDLKVASNMENKTALVKYGQSWKFYCNVVGYPTPSVAWFKNNATLENTTKIQIRNNNQTLAISDIGPSDNGTYSCEITNRLNEKVIKLATLGAIENDFDWLLVVIIILAIVLTTITALMTIKIYKDNKLKKELKLVGLDNFEKGNIDGINPQLRVEDQADLLPYDKKWEIPIENLILGKELGSGAFGVVVQGELSGFFSKESTTTVAVKTVNKFAGYECIKALASELKIMVHLGQHVNIVNLIGACTKDVMRKKLLVVVEFCLFGNLQEHILHNSNRFVDQKREDIDAFDWNIGPKSPDKEKTAANLQYTTLCFTSDSSNSNSKALVKNSEGDDLPYICSQDFLVWALQICKGMEYLASRNVLHGDLAARNVLLSENNVVKISDFGLARSMYKNGIYKKKEMGPLPVKWMAVESIGENIFSTQSDVWSFGVVLWEFFSLAKTPYPGMQVDQTFYNKLFSGYRMEMPYFATTQIYEMMLDCWNAIATKRPTFTQLAERIGILLEDSLKEYYLSINGSYIFTNSDQSEESSQTDYLALMSSPNIENIVPSYPHYMSNINYFHTCQNNAAYVRDKTDDVSDSNQYDNKAYVT